MLGWRQVPMPKEDRFFDLFERHAQISLDGARVLLALALVALVSWICFRTSPIAVDSAFRVLQFVSASLYCLGHGGNDAQQTMGVIAVLSFAHGLSGGSIHVPLWVVLSSQTAVALGTFFGGWRIVHTMGSKITRLTPMQGFCAATGGAIIGVCSARRVSAVRSNVAQNIVVAWVLTMPAAELIAALVFWGAGALTP